MSIELHHSTPACTGTFGLCGVVNQYARCDACGATYRVVARGDYVYVYEIAAAMVEDA